MRAVTRQIPTVTIHAMRFKRGTDSVLSRTRMTFTPEVALAYVKELSADYRAGVILDAQGTVLAGDERLARTAREINAGEVLEGASARGKVFAARGRTHRLLVVTGPFALPRVVHRDLATVLAAMGAANAQGTRARRIPHGTVDALLASLS
jgi:hypothetical protein